MELAGFDTAAGTLKADGFTFVMAVGAERIIAVNSIGITDDGGEVVVDVVKADDKVTIPNIGTVSVKDVPERRGKIMMGDRKGEEYVVEAHREPKIKLSKNFKEVLL